MAREIKFRAWNFKDKKMFSAEEMTVDQMAILPDGHFANIDGGNTRLSIIYSHEQMLPLQFTGLFDKNGNEIYEGDVVKVGEIVFEIKWYAQSSAFWLFSISPSFSATNISSGGAPARNWNWLDGGKAVYWHGMDGKSPEVEIIGNIYENPELLKV